MPFYSHVDSYRQHTPPPSPLLDPVPFTRSTSCKRSFERAGPSEEFIKEFESCPAAARACCRFVESGSTRVDIRQLELYRRQMPGSDGKGLVIGVAIRSSPGELQPLAIIENDIIGSTNRGIHFTGVSVDDQSQSFVGCLSGSADLHPVYRHMIYLDYLKILQNKTAALIWDWWKSGLDMDGVSDGLCDKIRRGR